VAVHKKILTFALAVSSLAFASTYLHAQTIVKQTKKAKHNTNTTIGFQSGRELLFNSSPLVHSKQSKVHYGINNSLVLRKPLNTHFQAEARISYGISQGYVSLNDESGNTTITRKAYKVAVPVTINYFCLPEHCKDRPYFGAGMQYNINLHDGNAISPFSNETSTPDNQMPGTKYISILFTQGVTFQVNTKIEINESFHFIPDNAGKEIGIDLGIGYKIQ